MAILKKGNDDAKKHKLATSKPFDTLESIAKKHAIQDGWETLANYLFGTTYHDEVNRALRETIGVVKVDLIHASKTELKPKQGHSGEIPLPEDWNDKSFDESKRYRLTIVQNKSPVAISIAKLDKWFIPDKEACDIRYVVEGDPECADRVDFNVYGSNYCECTDWNKGLGKYKIVEDEPIFKEEGIRAQERCTESFLDVTGKEGKNGWKGEANTAKGILSVKTGDAPRFINVAFSPYTVHLRYRKTSGDKTALLVLGSFWPEFEETKQEPAVTPNFGSSPATFQWTNADDQQSGALVVQDAAGQCVYMAAVTDKVLLKGAQSLEWDKNYRKGIVNGRFEKTYLDDSTEALPLKALLFKSTPYVAKVTTFTCKAKSESLKIKWEIKGTGKLERGLLIVTDREDKIVFEKALEKGDVSQQKHEFQWDGKYLPGVKNSRAKKDDPEGKIYEATPEDMPYRVQIQAHTPEDTKEGLALAAMHTEVRLYVHRENQRPDSLAYDPLNSKPSLELGLGSVVPGDPPQMAQRTKWFRHKLAEYGFHPGPVTDSVAANDAYKTALKEFKKSVPANGGATAGNFARLALADGADEAENIATETAIKTLRDSDRRKWFGDPSKVLADSNEPDYPVPSKETTAGAIESDNDKVNEVLRKADGDLIVWVDDRQYNTSGLAASGVAMDEDDNNFYNGETGGTAQQKIAANAFSLNNDRGTMDNGDAKTTKDLAFIPRPWIPLQVEPMLLSQREDLYGNTSGGTSGLDLASIPESRRKAMRRHVGPLRVDWTFEDLPADVSVIDPADYQAEFSRSRKYVAWALRDKQGTHNRKDTKRDAIYPNCPKTLGGIRPDSLADYYKEAYGLDDLSLAPWKAAAVTETESVATVLHEHLLAGQKKDTDLFEPRLGTAGVYFRPSIIAGDGYRARAEFKFEKFGDYEFPNLEVLKGRYPVTPQAHTAALRVWRRSSMRGYAIWAPAGTGHWPALVNGFRKLYRASHVYFAHEGATSERTFDITTVFTDDRYKKIISNNIKKFAKDDSTVALAKYWKRATAVDKARMTRDPNTIWPWSDRDDLGWEWPSKQNTQAEWSTWMNDFVHSQTWRSFREGLIIAILKEVEKQGVMRGHLFVEFKSSPNADYEAYRCANCNVANKYYWFIRKNGSTAGLKAGTTCPKCGGVHTLTYVGDIVRNSSLPWAAVGSPLGATWLFTTSDADTWAHEVGHHRHLIHAASAPGSQQSPTGGGGPQLELHDHESNTTQNWGTLQVTAGNDKGTKATERDWDRNCIMSYSSVYYGPTVRGRDTFCGKCLIRQRGWKVQTLGYPGADIVEP